MAIEYRWAEGRYDRLPSLAADLVSHKVELIAAFGPPCARAAKNATSTVPIVFTIGSDPVHDELVPSLALPGGNVTGISMLAVQLVPKRLELLSELIPQARTFALLVNPNNGYSDAMIRDVEHAARANGMPLSLVRGQRGKRRAGCRREIERAIAAFTQGSNGGLILTASPGALFHRELIVALAARRRLPAVYFARYYVTGGGLISYGPDFVDQFRRAAGYVDRILKGEKPADLPVQAPTKYELVINLQTAKAIGLEIPPDGTSPRRRGD